MKQFLKTKSSITAWLDKHKIKNYTLVGNAIYGYKVNVKGSVTISSDSDGFFYSGRLKNYTTKFRLERLINASIVKHKELKFIPVKFNIVTESFNLIGNKIKSMNSMPKKVGDDFRMLGNHLKNFKGLPKKIGGSIDLGRNRLINLVGSPKIVYGSFCVEHNYRVNSLIGGPELVHGQFSISFNSLSSLIGSPKLVKKSYICRNNNLTSLEGVSPNVGRHLIIKNDNSYSYYYQNSFIDFDYLPKKLGGDIEFSSTGGLSRYANIPTAQIMEIVKIREKNKKLAKKEKMNISKELKNINMGHGISKAIDSEKKTRNKI